MTQQNTEKKTKQMEYKELEQYVKIKVCVHETICVSLSWKDSANSFGRCGKYFSAGKAQHECPCPLELRTYSHLRTWRFGNKRWNDHGMTYIYIYHILYISCIYENLYIIRCMICLYVYTCLSWNFLWHLPRGCNFLCHRHFKLASVEHGDDCWCTRAMVVPHMASLQV